MRKIFNIKNIGWFLGPLFYLYSINYLFALDILNASGIFFLASFIFPPSFKYIKSKIQKKYFFTLKEFHRLFLIILFLALFNLINSQGSNNPNTSIIYNTNISTSPQKITEAKNYNEEFKEEFLSKQNGLYRVVSVVDGDTIKVLINNDVKTIRLIGIDTPESVHPEKPVECFGVEASNEMKNLLSGKMVYLENDVSQGNIDSFSRLLRYVYREDDLFINKKMIENGYALEYTYDKTYKFQADFILAQDEAKNKKLGLWVDKACDDFNKKIIK